MIYTICSPLVFKYIIYFADSPGQIEGFEYFEIFVSVFSIVFFLLNAHIVSLYSEKIFLLFILVFVPYALISLINAYFSVELYVSLFLKAAIFFLTSFIFIKLSEKKKLAI
jgi:hypothetical protein